MDQAYTGCMKSHASDTARSPRRQLGLTSVEYAVAGGLIVIAIVLALAGFGDVLKASFESIVAAF